jgi:glycosyltransferase involved in cell wall biosynthesis
MLGPKRIDQLTPFMSRHDAIGNHIVKIQELLRARGYLSEIFAVDGDRTLSFKSLAEFSQIDDRANIVIHHYSVGSVIPDLLLKSKSFRVLDYHNITPPEFFLDQGDWGAFSACLKGLQQLPLVRLCTDFVWADSQFNADNLAEAGYENLRVLPIIRDYSYLASLAGDPAAAVLGDGSKKTLLFVGRVAPNKAHHDAIIVLALYKKFVNPNIRIVFVGAPSPGYYRKLRELCDESQLSVVTDISDDKAGSADVLFLGKLSDGLMASIYQQADAFICLSDHEGFCVPLIEAMFFHLPIIAHRAGAVPETAGQGALLVDKTDVIDVIENIKTLLENEDSYKFWQERSMVRSRDFCFSVLERRFDELLNETVGMFKRRLASF